MRNDYIDRLNYGLCKINMFTTKNAEMRARFIHGYPLDHASKAFETVF